MIIASLSYGETRNADAVRFLDVEGPLATRAEAMVRTSRRKGRHHRRGGRSWTREDEALFRARLADLYEARARLVRAPD